MEQSAFINIDLLPGDARKELMAFYEFLLFKYKKSETNKKQPLEDQIKHFREFANQHLIDLPVDYKFDREEANER